MDAPRRMVGIVGAGLMGRAIAAECIRAGYHVLITDANLQVARDAACKVAAMQTTRRPDGDSIGQSVSARVVNHFAEFGGTELVIETVSESLNTKLDVLSTISPHMGGRMLVATNTSSIPLSELASAVQSPALLCGLHFCHPVAQRSLVEVVNGRITSAQTIRRACEFAESLGKSPVVVQDGPGFVLNRVLSPYLTESLELLLEGAQLETVNQVAKSFGMPYDPLRQLDEFGLAVALAVGGTLLSAYPERFIASELLIAMYKSQRQAHKSGRGWDAGEGNDRCDRFVPAVQQIIRDRRRGTRQPEIDEVRKRMLLPMLMEAAHVLQDGLVDGPATVDAILREGLGMTPDSPGLFGWARGVGADTILEWLHPLASLGPRFEPPPNLQRLLNSLATPSSTG